MILGPVRLEAQLKNAIKAKNMIGTTKNNNLNTESEDPGTLEESGLI